MPAFRILNPFPVYLDRMGLPASGGHLAFFDTGTDTPKDVFGDPDLTVNNGSAVLIDTAGRTVVDVWGSGSYRVRLMDADNTLIAEAENVEIPGGTGAVIPTLDPNKFLTNDGSVMQWVVINQVPDPTGSGGKILGTDGVNFLWQAPPAPPAPAVSDVAVTDNSVSISDGTKKILIQSGTANAPNVGGRDTSISVTFPVAFIAEAMLVLPIPRYSGNVSPLGNAPIPHLSSKSASGFTVVMSAGERDDTAGGFNFNAEIPFDWVAIGLVSV